MKKLVFVFAAAGTLIACTPKTAEVIEQKEEVSTFPTTDIAEGSKLYTENCGKCHKLKTVTDYTAEQWKAIMPKMAVKAKIDATAENKITQYVLWQIEQ